MPAHVKDDVIAICKDGDNGAECINITVKELNGGDKYSSTYFMELYNFEEGAQFKTLKKGTEYTPKQLGL